MSRSSALSTPSDWATVCVFGASWARPGDSLYAESVRLGAAIARRGYHLVNGGYSGTMEGSALGHREAGGTLREGVIVPALFPQRPSGGNEHLSVETVAPTLLARIDVMAARARHFVILPGTLGTLTELCAVWNMAHLEKLGRQTTARRIYAYEAPWRAVVEACVAGLLIDEDVARHIVFVKDAEEALALIVQEDRGAAALASGAAGGAAATGGVDPGVAQLRSDSP
jgi:uncharacterized protein (TIGR00730 family)